MLSPGKKDADLRELAPSRIGFTQLAKHDIMPSNKSSKKLRTKSPRKAGTPMTDVSDQNIAASKSGRTVNVTNKLRSDGHRVAARLQTVLTSAERGHEDYWVLQVTAGFPELIRKGSLREYIKSEYGPRIAGQRSRDVFDVLIGEKNFEDLDRSSQQDYENILRTSKIDQGRGPNRFRKRPTKPRRRSFIH